MYKLLKALTIMKIIHEILPNTYGVFNSIKEFLTYIIGTLLGSLIAIGIMGFLFWYFFMN